MSSGSAPAGQFFRHYQVQRKLGAGGMGVVYHAVDTKLNRHVALKFLPDDVVLGEDARAIFLREARAASALDHPNIGTVHGIEETEDGRPFIVMAYYDGRNLAEKIAVAPLNSEEAVEIAVQVARGLAEAHSHHIVHRDIKPPNILLTSNGLVKIVDFGVARVAESTQATQTIGLSGTVSYMSPEQVQGRHVDSRSDLWSFGVVLYQMVTGRLAFHASGPAATMYAIVHSAPEKLPDHLPAGLQNIIYRALAKDPAARYQTASEMLADLQALKRSSARPDDPTVTRRHVDESWRQASPVPVSSRQQRMRRLWPFAIPFVVALMVWPAVWDRIGEWWGVSSAPHIAVLPLEVAGGSGTEAAVADGLMESLTGRLSNLQVGKKSLWVVPASEVRRRRITDAASALKTFGANLVVTGTLVRDGSLLRLIVNLVDTKNMRQIGSGQLEDRAGDYSGLQDSAVAKLANLMNIAVTPEMLKNTGGSLIPAAYQSYLAALGYIQRYDKSGNLDKAVGLLEDAVAADPKFALGYSALGEAYLTRFAITKDQVWLDKAAANCTHALQLNESLAPVHVNMGRIHNASGNEALATQEFERAQRLEPYNADALAGMAQTLEKQKRLKEAEDMFRRAAVLRPDFWDGYSKLGNFYMRQKRPAEAEKQFAKVIELTPDNYVGYLNRGAALIEADRLDEAANMLQKAASLAPAYGTFANLGQVYFRQKKYAEAAKYTEQALKLNDKDFRLWTNLAGMYRFLGRDPDAVATYRKVLPVVEEAVKSSPQDGELHAQVAELYAYTGHRSEADTHIETALALGPDDGSVLARCADAADAIGQRDRAIALAKRALAHGQTLDSLRSDPEARGILSDSRLRSSP